MAAEFRIAATMSGFVIGVTSTDPDKSVARDDKTGWNAMSETHEPTERCSFAAKQSGIGYAACA